MENAANTTQYIASQIHGTNPKIDILKLVEVPAGLRYGGTYFPVMPSFESRPASDDDFETDVDGEGVLTIARKSNGPLRTPDAALVRIETGQSFCNACLSALGYLARYLEQRISVPDRCEMSDRLPPNVVLHWNLLALEASRIGGCHLCSLISLYVLKPGEFRPLGMLQNLQVELVLCSDEGTDSRAKETRLACALTPNFQAERTSDEYWEVFKLRLWPSPEHDGFFPRQAPLGDSQSPSLLKYAPPRGTNIRCAKHVATDWLDRCKNNHGGIHGACVVEDSSWLPTRLLDLSTARPGGIVKVVYPVKRPELFTAQKNLYITLSHSWGDWQEAGLPPLLEENKEQYELDGIPLDDLPPLFRDAIEIAGWFKGL
ncbi:hypothetical protein F5Y03DRAFT_303930 [Xylaria venustula]|nr:hypothetical protein F5Y03DRAFT_303930 [Xylaria venustula]